MLVTMLATMLAAMLGTNRLRVDSIVGGGMFRRGRPMPTVARTPQSPQHAQCTVEWRGSEWTGNMNGAIT